MSQSRWFVFPHPVELLVRVQVVQVPEVQVPPTIRPTDTVLVVLYSSTDRVFWATWYLGTSSRREWNLYSTLVLVPGR